MHVESFLMTGQYHLMFPHDVYITGVCSRIICMLGHLSAYDKVTLGQDSSVCFQKRAAKRERDSDLERVGLLIQILQVDA